MAFCFSCVLSRAVHIQRGHCGTLVEFCSLERRWICLQKSYSPAHPHSKKGLQCHSQQEEGCGAMSALPRAELWAPQEGCGMWAAGACPARCSHMGILSPALLLPTTGPSPHRLEMQFPLL